MKHWDEASEALYAHTPECWFRGPDDSGLLLSDLAWRIEHFLKWLTKGDTSQRLVHAAFGGEWQGPQRKRGALLAGFVSMVAVLRVGGCLAQCLDGCTSVEVNELLFLCMHLFQDVELYMPLVTAAGRGRVYVVAKGYLDMKAVLLKALVASILEVVSGRRSKTRGQARPRLCCQASVAAESADVAGTSCLPGKPHEDQP